MPIFVSFEKGVRDMSKTQSKPILNTSLPAQFRQIRLELAREPDHPEGEHGVAYTIIAPLNPDGRIDPKLWKSHRDACRVARRRSKEADQLGHLVHRPGGNWEFHYNGNANLPDESGYHFRRTFCCRRICLCERARQDAYLSRDISRTPVAQRDTADVGSLCHWPSKPDENHLRCPMIATPPHLALG
jgi:hypothetical protein